MYFLVGLPQEFKFPKTSEGTGGQEPVVICSNRDRSLILLLTVDSLHVWFCKPCVQIAALQRSRRSLENAGKNIAAIWKSDATTIVVATDNGRLLFFKVEIDEGNNESLYLKRGYSRKQQKAFDALFLGEGIPALTIKELQSVNLGEKISSLAVLRDELVVATEAGGLKRVRWDGTINEAYTVSVYDIQFGYDLQQSRGKNLMISNEHIADIEFSPLLGGFVGVLSGGRGFFLTAPNARLDCQNLQGVWAPDLRDAVCVHANHKYRLIVYGCDSGKGLVYHIDAATGALVLSHTLSVSTKEYPDAGLVGGSISKLAWTPDECAIIAAWSKGGIAVWTVFGGLLFCSLSNNYGLPTATTRNSLVVKAMEWGAEGYQLWLSTESMDQCNDIKSDGIHTDETDSGGSAGDDSFSQNSGPVSSSQRGSHNFLQLHFVKSPLTVNPCLTNHTHLFLQAEDKLYINLGSDKMDTDVDAGNVLIANKQWRVVPIRYTYLGSNWPIRYSAMDDSGHSIAIAGRTGLAHYSLLRKKWFLFGNEAQEKSMVVCGGLIWWRDYICVGCFDLNTSKDEIRFYPSTRKLDNAHATATMIPYAVLLINTFNDYLICLCADRHIMIFSIQVTSPQQVQRVDLRRIQDVSVNGFIPHPMCVTYITLSSLSAEMSQLQDSPSAQSAGIPESILLNVAGHLLMFQRDWSGPQPKQGLSRLRAVPFCNPMKVASAVENVWIPSIEETAKKQLSNSLWLSSGSLGMKVWLTLPSQDSVPTHFMAKRIMLPFDVAICPLAVLAEDAVILGAASDHSSTEGFTSSNAGTPHSGASSSSHGLELSVLERTSEIYLHQVLRQLLRRNLGYHALQLARCFISLPYFSHVLELLLHEVLEEEATSKEPIPDPLLPRVVLFSREFPQYRKTVAHCARKTEIALWQHLFSTVGSPKALFEECLVSSDLETASSYLIILQNLEKFYVSRQHATLLLESALESRSWPLARDVVKFLKRIDPHEADIEQVARPLPPRYGQRYASPPLDIEGAEGFSLTKPPLVRNTSLPFYEAENRMKEMVAKPDNFRGRKHSVSATLSSKQEEPEKHDVEVLLYRHARKLLITYRLRDLGLFAANLEEYELVGLLRKERSRAARVEDAVQALKQLHADFCWPLPILTHSTFYTSLRKYNSRLPATVPTTSAVKRLEEDLTDGDLGSAQSAKEILLSPVKFTIASTVGSEVSEDNGTEASENADIQRQTISLAGDLSRSSSESQLHDLSIELGNRGPKQSELEIRYLYEVMTEAECYDWCLLLALVLRDAPLFTRTINYIVSTAVKESQRVVKLSSDINKVDEWVGEECLGYKPFLGSVADDITNLHLLRKRLAPETGNSRSRHNSRLNSTASTDSNNSDRDEQPAAAPASHLPTEPAVMTNSESCVVS